MHATSYLDLFEVPESSYFMRAKEYKKRKYVQRKYNRPKRNYKRSKLSVIKRGKEKPFECVIDLFGKDIFRVVNSFLMVSKAEMRYRKRLINMEIASINKEMLHVHNNWWDERKRKDIFNGMALSEDRKKHIFNLDVANHFTRQPSAHRAYNNLQIGEFRFDEATYKPRKKRRDHVFEPDFTFSVYSVNGNVEETDFTTWKNDAKIWFPKLLDMMPYLWFWKKETRMKEHDQNCIQETNFGMQSKARDNWVLFFLWGKRYDRKRKADLRMIPFEA